MVEYYNLTDFTEVTGYISFMKVISQTSGGLLGYFLLLVVFLIPTITMIRMGKDINSTLHVNSLYTSILALFFYVIQFTNNSLSIYIPAMIWVVTLVIRIANK